MKKEILFDGKLYRLNSATNYYIVHDKEKKGKMLHRAIWERYSGEKIPKGYIIHHIDGNRLNNEFSNLMCVSPKEHSKLHKNGEAASKRLKEHPERVAVFLQKAKEWHKTPESRQMTRDRFKGVKHHPRECKACGVTFGTYVDHVYCSTCIRKFRARAKRHGVSQQQWMDFV